MSIVRCFEVREAVLGRFCIISAVKKILVYRGTRRYFFGSQWGVIKSKVGFFTQFSRPTPRHNRGLASQRHAAVALTCLPVEQNAFSDHLLTRCTKRGWIQSSGACASSWVCPGRHTRVYGCCHCSQNPLLADNATN